MKKHIFILLLISAGVSSSCSDLLTEKPNSYYTESNFFINNANVELALTGVYSVLSNLSHYGQYEMAIATSDDTYYIQGVGTDNTRRDISHYNLTAANQWIYDIWRLKYEGIDRANYLQEGVNRMENSEEDTQLQRCVAEARFLRALLAFDLVKYFGDVPFKTSYSIGYEDSYQPRTDRETIYETIIDDLNFAKSKLAWANSASSPERATQGAARALLMRVLLQRAGFSLQMDGQLKRPDEATRKAYLDAVIQEWRAFQTEGYHDFYSGGYPGLFKSFSAGVLDSKESIYEIAFFNPSGGSENSGVWATWNGPLVDAPGVSATETGNFMGRANAFFRVVPNWKNFFEATDQRRDVMICSYQYTWDKNTYNHVKAEQSNTRNWYPGKWRREWMPLGFKDPNNTDVNYCFLRYADVVLMAAEAYNETGETPIAWGLLNSIRERAGATAIAAGNYEQLLKAPKVFNLPFIDDSDENGRFRTALYWERGFELAFEGQRKWDLVRWGILGESLAFFNANVLNEIRTSYPAGVNFVKGKHELLPIPLDEIQINYKLEGKNNPGY